MHLEAYARNLIRHGQNIYNQNPVKKLPVATYSPMPLPAQYHRPWRA